MYEAHRLAPKTFMGMEVWDHFVFRMRTRRISLVDVMTVVNKPTKVTISYDTEVLTSKVKDRAVSIVVDKDRSQLITCWIGNKRN